MKRANMCWCLLFVMINSEAAVAGSHQIPSLAVQSSWQNRRRNDSSIYRQGWSLTGSLLISIRHGFNARKNRLFTKYKTIWPVIWHIDTFYWFDAHHSTFQSRYFSIKFVFAQKTACQLTFNSNACQSLMKHSVFTAFCPKKAKSSLQHRFHKSFQSNAN